MPNINIPQPRQPQLRRQPRIHRRRLRQAPPKPRQLRQRIHQSLLIRDPRVDTQVAPVPIRQQLRLDGFIRRPDVCENRCDVGGELRGLRHVDVGTCEGVVGFEGQV